MNIFIDSNVLFQDYFFENKSNKNLLEYCKRGFFNIYMSEIVRLELRRQFEKEMLFHNSELKKLEKISNRLKNKIEIPKIDIEKALKKYDHFYNNLSIIENYYILNFKNNFLPDIVDRAINKRKPFTEEKSELKDAIIWKTYSDYVENNDITDCILLTNNVSDFCDKNDKTKIHAELLKDTNKFKVINTSFEFLKINASILESPEYKFQLYINQITIDEDYVFDLISKNFESSFREKIHNKIERMHLSEIKSHNFIFDGQIIPYDIELIVCENIDFEIVGDIALISGIIYINCDVEIMEYNSVRDSGEDNFTFYDENTIQFKVNFNFDFKENEIAEDLEIMDIDVYDVS